MGRETAKADSKQCKQHGHQAGSKQVFSIKGIFLMRNVCVFVVWRGAVRGMSG